MLTFIYKVIRSFKFAGKGIVSGFQERNMRVHGVAMACVLFLGVFFQITLAEWVFVTIMIGLVIAAELLNTAIEEICNLLRDDLGLKYKATERIRDVAAGAVLVQAIVAFLVGWVIFFPRMWMMFQVLSS